MAAQKKGKKLSESDKQAVKERVAASEKNAEEMGRKIVAAAPGEKKSTTGLRVGAVLLWALGLVLEIVAVLVLKGTIDVTEIFKQDNAGLKMYVMIGALVLDLVAVVIGSQLWKKANHINPASEKNKAAFWFYNNMGVVASVICFAPIIILLLTDKDLDKKSKTIVTVIAAVALLIAGTASYDFDPVSQEDMQRASDAAAQYNDGVVYYTEYGSKYHYFADCQHIKTSVENDNVYKGTVEEAWQDGYHELCKTCARRAGQPDDALEPDAELETDAAA